MFEYDHLHDSLNLPAIFMKHLHEMLFLHINFFFRTSTFIVLH